jgi:hypothetical protein
VSIFNYRVYIQYIVFFNWYSICEVNIWFKQLFHSTTYLSSEQYLQSTFWDWAESYNKLMSVLSQIKLLVNIWHLTNGIHEFAYTGWQKFEIKVFLFYCGQYNLGKASPFGRLKNWLFLRGVFLERLNLLWSVTLEKVALKRLLLNRGSLYRGYTVFLKRFYKLDILWYLTFYGW